MNQPIDEPNSYRAPLPEMRIIPSDDTTIIYEFFSGLGSYQPQKLAALKDVITTYFKQEGVNVLRVVIVPGTTTIRVTVADPFQALQIALLKFTNEHPPEVEK